MENLFGTDGIRGRVVLDECDDEEALQRIVEERELTPQLMQLLGEALGRTVPEDGQGDTIVIGWDERPDNHTLASWLTLGFHASNCTVIHIGLASTPMLHYAVLETGARLGCMITASHNPVEDSGIKVFDALGRKSMPEYERLVTTSAYSLSQEDREIDMTDREAWMKPTSHHSIDHPQWLEKRLELEEKAFNTSLTFPNSFLLDSSKGHASTWLAAWLNQQGLDVKEVSQEAVAMNAGCGAGELSPGQTWTWNEAKTSEHLLVRSVTPQAIGAIVGAALDGDGDRCLLLQETQDGSRVFDGDDIADAILSSLDADWIVAASIESNLTLLTSVRQQESMVGIETAVGDRWLSHALSQHHSLTGDDYPIMLGIEDSGHLVLPSPHPNGSAWSLVGDGAMTLIMALLAMQESSSSSMEKGWKRRVSAKNPNRWMWDGKNQHADSVETMALTHFALAGEVTNWQRMGLEGEPNLMLIRCQLNGSDVSLGIRNSGTQAKTSVSLRFAQADPGFDAMLLLRSIQNFLLRTFNPVAH